MLKRKTDILLFLLLSAALFLSGCNLLGDEEKSPNTFSVSGRVVSSGNNGIDNVTVILEGETDAGGEIKRQAVTDLSGRYVFEKIPEGSYTLTPYSANFGFYPDFKNVTVSGSNTSIAAITGYSKGGGNWTDGYSVSGIIKDSSGGVLEGIVVALSGDEVLMYRSTDSEGRFSFDGLRPGTYLVSPSGSGLRFVPATRWAYINSYDIYLGQFSAIESEVTPPGSDRFDHDYFPLNNDATWTYRVTDTENGVESVTTETVRIQGTVQVRGESFYVLRDNWDAPLSFARVAGDSVYMFHDIVDTGEIPVDGDTVLRGAMKSLFDSETDDPFQFAWPVFPLDASPGDSYLLFHNEKSVVGAYFNQTWTGEYFGEESASVGAGTFATSRKFELVFDAYGYGRGAGTRQIHSKTVWLGMGAGMIKIHETWHDDGVLVREREKELIGYSIP